MTDGKRAALHLIRGEAEKEGGPQKESGGIGSLRAADVEFLDASPRAVTTVVGAVGPAVVSISVGREGSSGEGVEPIGSGSGVLLTPDGYVLTNHHVVRDANRIQLTLMGGASLGAIPVGFDPPNDLALVHQ